MIITPIDIEEFINKYTWTNSVTYEATAPHEYLLKKNVHVSDADVYVGFADYINKNGYNKRFWKVTFTYMDISGWKYWAMNNKQGELVIINRARI